MQEYRGQGKPVFLAYFTQSLLTISTMEYCKCPCIKISKTASQAHTTDDTTEFLLGWNRGCFITRVKTVQCRTVLSRDNCDNVC